jgi:hypothetical protein
MVPITLIPLSTDRVQEATDSFFGKVPGNFCCIGSREVVLNDDFKIIIVEPRQNLNVSRIVFSAL